MSDEIVKRELAAETKRSMALLKILETISIGVERKGDEWVKTNDSRLALRAIADYHADKGTDAVR